LRTELESLITHSSSLVELQEKELDKIIATVAGIKASFEDSIQKLEWQKALNILNQEIENNKKSLRLVCNNKIDICLLVSIALRCR
jgi:transcriptional regulatory protein LevR